MVKVKFAGCRAIEDHGTYVVARGLLSPSQLQQADAYFGGTAVQAKVRETGPKLRPKYGTTRPRSGLNRPPEVA